MAATGPLEISTLESWLWKAACVIRGPVDAPKFKDYILPLIFLKRLTDAVRAVAKVNPRLQGVIDVTDFNATQAGQRMLDDDRLDTLVQILIRCEG